MDLGFLSRKKTPARAQAFSSSWAGECTASFKWGMCWGRALELPKQPPSQNMRITRYCHQLWTLVFLTIPTGSAWDGYRRVGEQKPRDVAWRFIGQNFLSDQNSVTNVRKGQISYCFTDTQNSDFLASNTVSLSPLLPRFGELLAFNCCCCLILLLFLLLIYLLYLLLHKPPQAFEGWPHFPCWQLSLQIHLSTFPRSILLLYSSTKVWNEEKESLKKFTYKKTENKNQPAVSRHIKHIFKKKK